MKTVLVKRNIEKDASPNYSVFEKQSFITDIGIAFYDQLSKHWFVGRKVVYPKYWYQEIPLSQLIEEIMPTEKLENELYNWSDYNIDGDITRIDCEKITGWFKQKLTT